jgi:hypothetical protein
MPRPSSADTTYLEKKNGKWRVTLAVPRALHKKLGTRLKRHLHTDSLAVANRLKWQAVSELRAEITYAQTKSGKGALVREAIELAAYRGRAAGPEEIASVEDAITFRAEEIAGPPQSEEHVPGIGPVYQYDPQRQRGEAIVAGEERTGSRPRGTSAAPCLQSSRVGSTAAASVQIWWQALRRLLGKHAIGLPSCFVD